MINRKEFDEMKKDLDNHEISREKTIKAAREIIRESKLIIYAVQRGNMNEAEKKLPGIKQMLKKLDCDTDMATVARQEYVEAVTLFYFIRDGKLVTRKELGIDTFEYLLGLCDLTGELMRKAVNSIIKGKPEEAEKIRNLVDGIYHEFLKFNLGNGELRKKTDQIKWNLEKLEGMMYDLRVKHG